jgi:hypothetical protein
MIDPTPGENSENARLIDALYTWQRFGRGKRLGINNRVYNWDTSQIKLITMFDNAGSGQ